MDKIEELICEFNAERDWRVKKIEIYKSIPHRYVNKLWLCHNKWLIFDEK